MGALAKPQEGWESLGGYAADQVRVAEARLLHELESRLAQLPDGQRLEIDIDLPRADRLAGARLLGYPGIRR